MYVEYTSNNRILLSEKPEFNMGVRYAVDKGLQEAMNYINIEDAEVWPYAVENSIVKELIICPKIYCLMPRTGSIVEQFCCLRESSGSTFTIDFGITQISLLLEDGELIESEEELLMYSVDLALEKVAEEDLNMWISHLQHCVWVNDEKVERKILKAMKRRLLYSLTKMQSRYG